MQPNRNLSFVDELKTMSAQLKSVIESICFFLTLFVFTDSPLSCKNTEMAKLSAQKLGSGV